jgi:hypothetical protein
MTLWADEVIRDEEPAELFQPAMSPRVTQISLAVL